MTHQPHFRRRCPLSDLRAASSWRIHAHTSLFGSCASGIRGFVKLDERGVLNDLTTAVHEKIVAAAGSYGFSANATGGAQWVGLVVSFKWADTTP